MVEPHHDRCRNKYSPIAVERQNNEGAKDMEVRLDPATSQIDQERGHEHLTNRDDMTSLRRSRPSSDHPNGKSADGGANEYRPPDMNFDLAGLSAPRPRCNQKGSSDGSEPLHDHQPFEKAVRPQIYFIAMLREELGRARGRRRTGEVCFHFRLVHGRARPLRFASVQPKTKLCFGWAAPLRTREIIACSPALSPACPRDSVMPPLNNKCPSAANKSVCPDVSAPNLLASAPPGSDRTVTPGIFAALRCRLVSSHSALELVGFTNST